MRLLAGLVLATLALAAPAADAITRTVHVPFVHCDVTVTTRDYALSASNSGVHLEWWGSSDVDQTCL